MKSLLGQVLALLPLLALASNHTSRLKGALLSELIQDVAVPPAGAAVTIDFYYGPACVHCLEFLHEAILPLINAGLPGDRVKVSVLPFIRLEAQLPVAESFWDTYCRASDVCFYALAPICALKSNVPAAVPIDSPELAKAIRFAECNQEKRLQSHPDSNLEVSPEMRAAEDAESRACAAQVGIPYDGPGGVKACADGPESLSLVHSPGFKNRVVAYEAKLKQSGQQAMPYIFLNGDVLRCPATIQCNSVWTPQGEQPLPKPGTLLSVVCSKLNPAPPACTGVGPGPAHVAPTPKCANCMEVGPFRWRPTEAPVAQRSWLAPGCAVVGGLAVAAMTWVRARRARADAGLGSESAVE